MNDVDKFELIMNDIKKIQTKYDNLYRNTGNQFNIFKITNMTYKEVHICQVIKELIDPHGSHYQGDVYFRLFAKHVLKIDNQLNEDDYANISIIAEQVIPNNRRIDIYIEIGDKFAIPIEAKIGASDLEEQCYDYFKFALDRKKTNTILYYLTLDGKEPDSNSVKNIDKSKICLISFKNEITTWLKACIDLTQTKNIVAVSEIMIQLLDVLNEIAGQKEAGMKMEIKELINNKETFKNTALLSSVVAQIEKELKINILKALDEKITGKYKLNKIGNKYDFEQVADKSRSSQGCCYKIYDIENKDYAIALRIAFGNYLYAQICLVDANNEIVWDDISKTITRSDYIISSNETSDKNSIAWKYMINDKSCRPCFENPNDLYYGLIEKNNFDKFVVDVLDDLECFLKNLKEPYKVEYRC